MKNWLKIFVAIVILTVCVVCFGSGRAEAAYTTDGTYYPDLWTEVDWGSNDYLKDSIRERNEHFVVMMRSDGVLFYYFLDGMQKFQYQEMYNGHSSYFCTIYDSVIVINGSVYSVSESISGKYQGIYFYYNESSYSGYPSIIGSTYDYRCSGLESLPHSNMLYEFVTTPTSTVSLSVDGKDVTITEPYEYYFVSYAYDKVRLIFSDEPLTADYVSLDKVELYSGEQTTVCYTWDEDNPDFLASRMVFDYDWVITHPLSADYSCNYDIVNSRNGYVILSPKNLYPELDELYAAFPDEFDAYPNFIILRQGDSSAYTHDVVFYGWKDLYADLIIRWGDSNIRAARKGKVVSEQIMARFDLVTRSWVIDENTPISICQDEVFSIPYIYYCNVDLYIQEYDQYGWYTNRITAYMADIDSSVLLPDEPDDGGSDDEITGIEWLDDLLKGLGSLLSRLFVPSASYIQKKIDVLTSRFTFWKSVADTVYVFFNFLRDTDFTKPPKVVLDLSAANSEINYGLSAFSLDMTWYEPYKPEVDVLLSAIMWLTFIWNTFKALPATISGVGGSFASTMVSSDKKGGE